MAILIETLQQEWANLLRLTPKFLLALILFGVVLLLGRAVARFVGGSLARASLPASQQKFFIKLTRWLFVLLGLIVALNVLGLKSLAGSLVAGGGVSAIVLGFALRGIGENFLAGLFLVIGRTFRVGDVIASGDFEGQVEGIELRHTHIRSADGRDIYIPSIEIFSRALVNYTRDGLRRLSFSLGLDYADDIEAARTLLLGTVADSGLVLTEPKPGVLISAFQANYVELRVYFWIDTMDPPQGLTPVPTQLMERCRIAVLAAGFTVSSEVTTAIAIACDPALKVRVEGGGSAA